MRVRLFAKAVPAISLSIGSLGNEIAEPGSKHRNLPVNRQYDKIRLQLGQKLFARDKELQPVREFLYAISHKRHMHEKARGSPALPLRRGAAPLPCATAFPGQSRSTTRHVRIKKNHFAKAFSNRAHFSSNIRSHSSSLCSEDTMSPVMTPIFRKRPKMDFLSWGALSGLQRLIWINRS
jgi:hypothetical protein